MNTVFVINPKAGKGKNTDSLINEITRNNAEYYITKSVGDAEVFVRNYCTQKGPARFIACGGDGTLNEVLNGTYGFNAEIGVMPMGTGNDFCRNLDGNFPDVASYITSPCRKVDVIRYTTCGASKLCANMINIGFDCNVADMTATIKKKTFLSGPLAYFVSIFVMLIRKKGADLKIEFDDEVFYDGPVLLTSIANGKFCGGGIMSNPIADISDGNMNVNVIYDVLVLKFISLLPYYMKGTHMNVKNIDKVIYNTNCKKIKITPNTKNFRICVDGEIQNADIIEFEILPLSVNFVTKKQ